MGFTMYMSPPKLYNPNTMFMCIHAFSPIVKILSFKIPVSKGSVALKWLRIIVMRHINYISENIIK